MGKKIKYFFGWYTYACLYSQVGRRTREGKDRKRTLSTFIFSSTNKQHLPSVIADTQNQTEVDNKPTLEHKVEQKKIIAPLHITGTVK